MASCIYLFDSAEYLVWFLIYTLYFHLIFFSQWISQMLQIKLHAEELQGKDKAKSFRQIWPYYLNTSSAQLSCSVMSNSLQPHGLQHTRPPCPSPIPRVYSNSCPLSLWCHPTISSSVIPFCSHLQAFPASGSFQMNQFFASGGQSIEVSASASVLPMNIQDWFPLGLTGLISLKSKGLFKSLLNFGQISLSEPQFSHL